MCSLSFFFLYEKNVFFCNVSASTPSALLSPSFTMVNFTKKKKLKIFHFSIFLFFDFSIFQFHFFAFLFPSSLPPRPPKQDMVALTSRRSARDRAKVNYDESAKDK